MESPDRLTACAPASLDSGKAPPELLADIFAAPTDPRVLQGPGVGLDAAIIAPDAETLVVSSDPITFVAANAAQLAVTVNANDIYAVGAEPQWMLATVLAPPGADADALGALLRELHAACRDAGIALVGGHTEATDAVTRTVVSCTIFGSAPQAQIIPSNGARAGDVIIQAGAAAVEGTAILGHPALLEQPGISIAAAACALREIAGVHAMHDVTEGGLATAALELAEAAGLAPQLRFADLLWLPETLAVCEQHGLDPLGLLGSGTLLAAVAPESADQALAALSAAAVAAAPIGRVGLDPRATLTDSGQARPLPRFPRDEALRALADAE